MGGGGGEGVYSDTTVGLWVLCEKSLSAIAILSNPAINLNISCFL